MGNLNPGSLALFSGPASCMLDARQALSIRHIPKLGASHRGAGYIINHRLDARMFKEH